MTEPTGAPPAPPGAPPVREVALWAALIPLAYAPSLLFGSGPDAGPLAATAAATLVAAFAVERLARGTTLDRAALALEPRAPGLLLLALALWAGVSIARTWAALAGFGDYAMAGLFSQSFWTLLHGHPFANSQESVNGTLASHFGIHFSPTLLIVAPFYALWPNTLVLMIAQTLAVGLATIPIFSLTRPRAGGAAALALSLALLAVPLFARAGLGDFHDACFLPAPLLAAAWALERRRLGWLAVFVLLALGVREDAGLTVAFLGVFAALRGRGVGLALGLIALGLGWFALVTRLVMPMFASPGIIADPQRFFEAAFGHWGRTAGEAVAHIVTHPLDVVRWLAGRERAQYVYGLLLPLLLVPPLLDLAALIALPSLAINLLSRYMFMHSAAEPYAYVPLTFLALAVARLATRLAERAPEPRRHATALAVGLVVLAGALPATLNPGPRVPLPELPEKTANALVRNTPQSARLYAPIALYPALHRRETFDCWWNTQGVPHDAGFRARYDLIVLWPATDPAGDPRDAAFADSVAGDPRFVEREGYAPLRVFEPRR